MSEQPVDVAAAEPPVEESERDAILGGEADPAGVGGFLYLVGLGVFLSPLFPTMAVLQSHQILTDGRTWEALTTPDSPMYNALWAPLLIGEMSMNVLFIAASVWLIILFQRRSRRFPPAYVGYQIAALIFVLIDTQALSVIEKDWPGSLGGGNSGVGRAVVSAAIWVPYMIRSRRVRNTFIN